jgi:hypothetical protein
MTTGSSGIPCQRPAQSCGAWMCFTQPHTLPEPCVYVCVRARHRDCLSRCPSTSSTRRRPMLENTEIEHMDYATAARTALDEKTKPRGSLGLLEDWAVRCVPPRYHCRNDKYQLHALNVCCYPLHFAGRAGAYQQDPVWNRSVLDLACMLEHQTLDSRHTTSFVTHQSKANPSTRQA